MLPNDKPGPVDLQTFLRHNSEAKTQILCASREARVIRAGGEEKRARLKEDALYTSNRDQLTLIRGGALQNNTLCLGEITSPHRQIVQKFHLTGEPFSCMVFGIKGYPDTLIVKVEQDQVDVFKHNPLLLFHLRRGIDVYEAPTNPIAKHYSLVLVNSGCEPIPLS